MTTNTLLKLKPKNLLTHPRNMRRFYPVEQLREMAHSIEAVGGVLNALIVIKSEEDDHKYFVVDGNFRLAGGRLLGDRCPPLECKLVEQSEAEQLLSMVVANKIRYDVDPVSEGIHYKALKAEGLSVRDISKKTGVYEKMIYDRLLLADLDEPIQKKIVAGRLPASAEAARAFLTLKPAVRVKLAERLSENPSLKIATVISACERLAQKAAGKKPLRAHPATELSGAAAGGSMDPKDLRWAALSTCKACNQYEGALAKNAEPAWSMVVHVADATCDKCALKDIQKVCDTCPLVDALRKLVGRKETSSARR